MNKDHKDILKNLKKLWKEGKLELGPSSGDKELIALLNNLKEDDDWESFNPKVRALALACSGFMKDE